MQTCCSRDWWQCACATCACASCVCVCVYTVRPRGSALQQRRREAQKGSGAIAYMEEEKKVYHIAWLCSLGSVKLVKSNSAQNASSRHAHEELSIHSPCVCVSRTASVSATTDAVCVILSAHVVCHQQHQSGVCVPHYKLCACCECRFPSYMLACHIPLTSK